MSTYNFQGTIASRGYHIYKKTTRSNAKVNKKVKIEIEPNQSSIAIDPYAFAVKAKEKFFDGWRTIAYVPREISRYIYFFIKKENEKITGNAKSLNCKPSPISSGTEIPLQVTFSCPVEWVRDKMKDFIDNFYSYDFTGILCNDESSDDSDIEIDLESVDVIANDDDEEEADKMKPVSPVVDKEITNISIQQEAACIFIDDN